MMNDWERIEALEAALADLLGIAESYVALLEQTREAKAVSEPARRNIETARALLAEP